MVLPAAFDTYKHALDTALKSVFEDRDLGLYQMQRYHIGWIDTDGNPYNGQGKGIRPLMCLLSCEAAGGDWHNALPAAAAIELVHNFSLIHDDIQDGDIQRRHRDTVWHVWGLAQGINAGDSMRGLATLTLLKGATPIHSPTKVQEAIEALEWASLEMIEGQYLDITYEHNTLIRTNQYLDMISRKTGALIECSFYLGALLATNEVAIIQSLKRLGRQLGLVFQIRDDYLGVWGNEQRLGKPIASDINRKKMCLPVVYALQSAKGKDRETLHSIYNNCKPSTTREVEEVLRILEKVKAKDYCQTVAQEQCDKVYIELDALHLELRMDSQIRELASFFLEREY